MKPTKRIVIAFGRFQPPTVGHVALVDFLTNTASRLGADMRLYPSATQDSKKNPLPFAEKVRFLKLFFPRLSINDNPAIRTPIDAFADCSQTGYRELYVVVGSDRVADFKKLGQYLVPPKSPKYHVGKSIAMDTYEVIAVPGDRDPDADDVSGMSASKMRGFVLAGQFEAFKQGVPKPVYADQMYKSLKRYMNVKQEQSMTTLSRTAARQRILGESAEFTMVAIDPDDSPSWKQGPGHTAKPKVVWQMHSLASHELNDAFKIARDKHPKATISIENKSGRVLRAVKPGQPLYGSSLKEDAADKRGHDGEWHLECKKCHHEWYNSSYRVKCPKCGGTDLLKTGSETLDEAGHNPAGPPKPPTETDRLKITQQQELIGLKQRQANSLMAAKLRDVANKGREQQVKLNAPKAPASRS